MTEFFCERQIDAFRGGEKLTLDVGERDGYVVIGLKLVGVDDGGRAWLLDATDAVALAQALDV
jgi:hypothetical protein